MNYLPIADTSITDIFFKTRKCPLFRGFTALIKCFGLRLKENKSGKAKFTYITLCFASVDKLHRKEYIYIRNTEG